jgi:hypothetical protein
MLEGIGKLGVFSESLGLLWANAQDSGFALAYMVCAATGKSSL